MSSMVCDAPNYYLPVETHSPIQKFYHRANIFITGATGFLGKVLIEKLLRTCPSIGGIFIVVREKKGKSVEERITDLISSKCFNRIKKEHPTFASKLFAIYGDIGLNDLGINAKDRESLVHQVDVVFHIAATVRFDEILKSAILQNVRGTREVLMLCKNMKKLRSVVHVSTAYANCPHLVINECLYDPPMPCEEAISLAETLDEVNLESMKTRLLGQWPNTYAFTKAIAEDVVRKYSDGLPVGIFRPGIVVCTSSEPMIGWIDNLYGPSGVISASATGVLRTMQVQVTFPANIVPCDLAVNGLITAAWDTAEKRSCSKVLIYNFTAPDENAPTWEAFQSKMNASYCSFPPSHSMWYPGLTTTSNRLMLWIYRLFMHLLPALLFDLCFLTVGKKPQLYRIYQRVHKFTDAITYFTMKRWRFDDRQVVDMWKRLTPQDQDLFNFNMRTLDWDMFFKTTWHGMRTYLVHDNPETIPAARIRLKRLYWAHRLLQTTLFVLTIWLSFNVLSATLPTSIVRYTTELSLQSLMSGLMYSTSNIWWEL